MLQPSASIRTRKGIMNFRVPKVMGIINVTPDSFYSASRTLERDSLVRRVAAMAEAGVDIIDIGGCSTRPGAPDVSPDEEYSRLARGLDALRRNFPDIPVSVDTFRAEVARRCVEEWGVDIINDIGGGTLDADMWDTVADLGVAYVLMHIRGVPQTMQNHTDYEDVVADVMADLACKASELHSKGVADVIIDPGFGFAKEVEQNYRLLSALPLFRELGMPVLAGLSHKTMIWKSLGITPDESTVPTVALDAMALQLGADLLRVHEVEPAVQTVKLFSLLRDNSV